MFSDIPSTDNPQKDNLQKLRSFLHYFDKNFLTTMLQKSYLRTINLPVVKANWFSFPFRMSSSCLFISICKQQFQISVCDAMQLYYLAKLISRWWNLQNVHTFSLLNPKVISNFKNSSLLSWVLPPMYSLILSSMNFSLIFISMLTEMLLLSSSKNGWKNDKDFRVALQLESLENII